MKVDYSELHVVFITETDDVAKTDEKYIRKFLQVHYKEYWKLIHPVFLNMGGNTNITKEQTVIEVNKKRAEIFGHPYFQVIQCFDKDRNKDKGKIQNLIEFANQHGYHPVLFSQNVEQCFYPTGSGKKKDRAQEFYSKTLSINDLDIEIFRHDIEECKKKNGISNLDLVLRPIIKKIKK